VGARYLGPVLFRETGLVILLAGLGVAALLTARPVTVPSGYSIRGEDVIERRTTCGRALSILYSSEYHEDVRASTRDDCTRAARSRLAGAAFIGIASLLLAAIGIRKGPYRPPEPLSSVIPRPRRAIWPRHPPRERR
jgi:hypothetical protein